MILYSCFSNMFRCDHGTWCSFGVQSLILLRTIFLDLCIAVYNLNLTLISFLDSCNICHLFY
jgi:hypothetical protein